MLNINGNIESYSGFPSWDLEMNFIQWETMRPVLLTPQPIHVAVDIIVLSGILKAI